MKGSVSKTDSRCKLSQGSNPCSSAINLFMIFDIITAVIVLATLVAGIIFIFKKQNSLKPIVVEIIATIFIILPYVAIIIYQYKHCGPDDWNFKNTLPLANMSPLMFTLSLVALLPIKKIKNVIHPLYCLLYVGMVGSALASCIFFAVNASHCNFYVAMNSVSHVAIALYAIYLLVTKQVVFDKKTLIRSISVIYGIVVIVIVLNLIFKTDFFGLTFTEKYNIYGTQIIKNPYLSAVVYFVCLNIVIFSSYFLSKLIDKKAK